MGLKVLLAVILLMTLTTSDVSGNGYMYIPYDDFQPHQRRPYPNENFFHQPSTYFPRNLRKHPLWSEFWDTYNYQGPLEEDHAKLPGGHVFFEREYPKPVGNYPRVYPHQTPTSNGNSRDDDYNRYKDYFFRRFGSNFDRNEPRY
ncbi:hypothetical protein JTE90_025426 [Oedothorax gibbosus]|uniref:Uncharacterized protein n=1 Tax=Oedothorax gibbosus TaxID=931172 RepID=A0AAV6UAS3_9ARAC|nr:hypothetical protein JTE90_025426 [Oedothorax gibbosus]